MNNDD